MPLYALFYFFIFTKYDDARTNAVFPKYQNACKCVPDFIQQFKLILSELRQ